MSPFQSTRPARGATIAGLMHRLSAFDISIHAPREGRDRSGTGWYGKGSISIHAPREGRDCNLICTSIQSLNFNPRAPRGARQQK